MTTTELTPRSYADLLALVDASAPVSYSIQTPPGQTPAPPAGGKVDYPPRQLSSRDADTYTEQQIANDLQLVVLGTVGDSKAKIFSRYHRKTVTISAVSRMQYEDLLQLAGAPARSRVVDSFSGDDVPPGQYTLKDVKRALAMLAGFRTITEGGEVGSGLWSGLSDDGKIHDSIIIVGNSEAADWNGDKTLRRIEQPLARGRLLNFDQQQKNWYDFDTLRGLMQQAADPAFRVKAMEDCRNYLKRWHWKNMVADPYVLTGLIFASWVQTMWDWRPIVSVIGPTSSGKSMFCNMVKGIFGPLGKSCSDQTAAGVRQLIESSARIFMLDEFDAEDKAKAEEMGRILKMLRASGRGDAIVRGTAGQKAHEFVLRHLVWVLGIQIGTQRQADKNRFITAELLPPLKELEGKLVVPDAAELTDLGQRMLAAAIYCAHDARKMATVIKDTRIQGIDARVVESHAVPVAMLACIQGWDETAARELLSEVLEPLRREEATGSSDEQALMESILGAHIQIGPNRLAVSQMVDNVMRDGPQADVHKEALEGRGIKIDRFTGRESKTAPGGRCILLAYGIISEHLLKNTKWNGQAIEQILKRIRGACGTRRRVGGQKVYVVGIPLEVLAADHLGIEEGTLPLAGSDG